MNLFELTREELDELTNDVKNSSYNRKLDLMDFLKGFQQVIEFYQFFRRNTIEVQLWNRTLPELQRMWDIFFEEKIPAPRCLYEAIEHKQQQAQLKLMRELLANPNKLKENISK